LGWAQKAAPLREDSISAIGLGVPVTRRLLLELGRRLAGAGAIATPADVFWLEETELDADVAALESGRPVQGRAAQVRRRKALWRSRKRVSPPATIPPIKSLMGFKVADFVPDATREPGRLKGVAASGGRVTGPARVMHGPEDFGRMRAGDVLVAGTPGDGLLGTIGLMPRSRALSTGTMTVMSENSR